MINALLGLVGMFLSMVAVVLLWIGSGWPKFVDGQPWCAHRAFDGRDFIFMTSVAATVILSLFWWYVPNGKLYGLSCQYMDPGLQTQVCIDAARSAGQHNAWHHARNWLPIAGLLLATIVVLLRMHTRYVRPAVARILTRLILLAVDILAVWQLYIPYDPDGGYERLWPLWAAFGTTFIASFTAMRSLPFFLRWLID